jgi:hypothetical protein
MKLLAWMLFAGMVSLVGCGGNSNIGKVTGKVTLDGQPVSDATVVFSPTKGGSPSNARTDSQGVYTLSYTRSEKGAEIGQHQVRITTFQHADADSEPPILAVPEKIPAKYNSQSELKVNVESGDNTHDFELKTDGPVIQPIQERSPC